jgi:hypothetical protein
MANYVKAPSQSNGCIVACLGMITDQTYKEVLSGMEQYWKNEGSEQGVDDEAWMAYLAARGYATQDIPHDYVPTDQLISPWPIKPFAPIHIVFVYDEGPHAVIMTNDGTILDPNDEKISRIDQYYRVYRIVGIWKVGEQLEFI